MISRILSARRMGLCAAIAGFLAASALSSSARSDSSSPPASSRSSNYVLRPQDLIKIQVFQEPDLDRELRVSQDHAITLPLIGTVDLRKRTVHEAEALIAELYNKDYLVNPQINITVLEYSPQTVNVLGAVNNPGAVVIPSEHPYSLLDAIAHSGGFSRLANRGKVSLTRTLSKGDTENYTIDADQLVAGDAANKWVVQDGDIIFIPERVL